MKINLSPIAESVLKAVVELDGTPTKFTPAEYTEAANELLKKRLVRLNCQDRLVPTTKGACFYTILP